MTNEKISRQMTICARLGICLSSASVHDMFLQPASHARGRLFSEPARPVQPTILHLRQTCIQPIPTTVRPP
jgi:hypothetical protein